MEPVTIHKEIRINAPAKIVWRFIGTEAGLRAWWDTDLALEAKKGGHCEERSVYQGETCHLRGEITDYDPPRQLSLIMRNVDGADAWPAFASITMTLTEEAGETVVTLVHQAFGQVHEMPYAVAVDAAYQTATSGGTTITNQLRPRPDFTPQSTTIFADVNQHLAQRSNHYWHTMQEARWHICLTMLSALSVSESV